jgi:hypothetical protein
MRMVYNAKSLQDAEGIRDVLADSGIAAHLADPSGETGPVAAGGVRVCVDNNRLDAARRAIATWQRLSER